MVNPLEKSRVVFKRRSAPLCLLMLISSVVYSLSLFQWLLRQDGWHTTHIIPTSFTRLLNCLFISFNKRKVLKTVITYLTYFQTYQILNLYVYIVHQSDSGNPTLCRLLLYKGLDLCSLYLRRDYLKTGFHLKHSYRSIPY